MDISADATDLLDPFPDIVALFLHYNILYFDGDLHTTSVRWSSERMTSCAGTCEYGNGAPIIKLSAPILRYRTSDDLKDVLLHEMIHAYVFTKGQHRRDGDHGPRFRAKMHEINAATLPDLQRPAEGYKLDVHHHWIAEVREHQKHHWRCQQCGDFIQRAMNRPPQEADCRARAGAGCTDARCHFHVHRRGCGGAYIKVSEPAAFTERQNKKRKRQWGDPKFATETGAPTPAADSKGRVTLEDFFSRIPKEETGGEHPPQQSSTAQQAQQAEAGRPPGPRPQQPRRRARPEQEENTEERRDRLLQATLQRIGRMKAEELESSKTGVADGPLAGSNGHLQESNHLMPAASEQPVCLDGAAATGHEALLHALDAPKRRRPQDKTVDLSSLDSKEDAVSIQSASRAGEDAGIQGTNKVYQEADEVRKQRSSGEAVRESSSMQADETNRQQSTYSEQVNCPICQRQWPVDSMTNAEINEHVDACLSGML